MRLTVTYRTSIRAELRELLRLTGEDYGVAVPKTRSPVNLYLATINVWTFADDFTPTALFRALGHLLQAGDVIALGAYQPSARTTLTLTLLGATEHDAGFIYSVTFEMNRPEHPNGRSFELAVSPALLSSLATEATRDGGQDDKPLFFDHLVAYRRGKPPLPLVCFHDAFYGGALHVSEHYSERTISTFAAELPSRYELQRSPENSP